VTEFDSFAADYEKVHARNVRITGETSEYFAAYKAAYIARKVARHGGTKILDYGCGVGLLARHLRRCVPGVQIDGFDVSQDSLVRIDKPLLSQGVFTSELSELGNRYDIIVFSNVLHHVRPEERESLVAQTGARLPAGGKFVVFEHNPVNPLTRWAVAHCPFDENAVLLRPREIYRYLQSGGLRLVGRDYIVFFPRWLRWFRPLEPFLCWCPLGAQYVVVGEKFA